ncbi:MAG: alpha/beta hydrolase [bacterium]|nr:alpha/beta hydrolase [bacterium]
MQALVRGLKINYIIIGEGNPLLILHGWGSNKEKWQKVAEILSQKGFKVVVLDLPGFGESQEPDLIWDLDEYALFINEFAKSLGLQSFNLLGHSFGGAVASKYALKYPEKINKLFLVGAACIRKEKAKRKLFKVLSIFKFIPFARRFFYRFIVKSDYPQTKGIMRDIYLKCIKEDLSDELEKITAPTIIIWGEKDDITPLSQAKLINSKIKNSKLFIIPNQGHALQLTAHKELCSYI